MAKKAKASEPRTIVDVLETAFGNDLTAARADSLSDAEIDQLAEDVGRHTSRWVAPPPSDEVRIYSGGWIAANLNLHSDYLLTSLAYASSIVIHDPVAEWFNPHRGHLTPLPGIPSLKRNSQGRPAMIVSGDEATVMNAEGFYSAAEDRYSRTRSMLHNSVPKLGEMSSLIRAGVVIPVSQVDLMHQYQKELASAVRFDIDDIELAELIGALDAAGDPPARTNVVRGGAVEPSAGVALGYQLRSTVQNPAYYFHKSLMIASMTDARYVPPAGADAALMEYRLRQLGKRLDTKTNHNAELRIVPGLVAAQLPFLEGVGPKVLLAIRDGEEAFSDWRSELRDAIRMVESLPSDKGTFEAEARDVLKDKLLPRAKAVQKAVSTSGVLKEATRDSVAEFGISGVSIGFAAAAMGTEGAVIAAVAASVALPLRWAYKAAFPSPQTGSNAVLAKLVKSKR